MTRYAILLSVEEYSSLRRTPFAHADAELLANALVQHCDYAEQHVLRMLLKPGGDYDPPSVLARVKEKASELRPGDTLLFFFAGHGDLDKGEPYLLLPDSTVAAIESTALPLRDLTEVLKVNGCGCFRILDACHSGADVRDAAEIDAGGFVRSVMQDSVRGWVTLAACAEDESSVCDPLIGNGIFTHYLCDEIRTADSGSEVLPETLKIKLVPRVLAHAAKLGYKQTPTLNASVSGNLSLATRRQRNVEPAADLGIMERIASIRRVEDILKPERLTEYLETLASHVERTVRNEPLLSINVEREGPMHAGLIDPEMHPTIVELTRREGLSPRHHHSRREEGADNPFAVLASLGRPRKVTYGIEQSHSFPPSAIVVRAPGDGRCIPDVLVLAYVIPLQLGCCFLVAGFRRNWLPHGALESVLGTHSILTPTGDADAVARELADSAVAEIRARVEKHVAQRVRQLEGELGK